MIEVSAKLLTGSIYLAGETVECQVTFKHSGLDGSRLRDDEEIMAWSSVQIHCWVSGAEQMVNFDALDAHSGMSGMIKSTSSGAIARGSACELIKNYSRTKAGPIIPLATSFMPAKADSGRSVFATPPQILFCDLSLGPGEAKTFYYKETLPKGIPPSYRGHAVRYWYKVAIGTQRVGAPIKILQIPLKLLVIHGFPGLPPPVGVRGKLGINGLTGLGSDTVTPSNPFLLSSTRDSGLDVAMEFLQGVTSRKAATAYNVTHTSGKVGTFYLYKTGYRLGEDIVGTFNLKDSKVRCVKFLVTLQSQETIAEEFRKRTDQSPAVSSYSKYHQYCLNLDETQLILPIPLHVSPTFQTELVALKWRLHFEFVTTTTPISEFRDTGNITEPMAWTGPSSLEIETMVWDLPIKIFPASPVTVAQGLQLESEVVGKV